jgi:hypothetical protein
MITRAILLASIVTLVSAPTAAAADFGIWFRAGVSSPWCNRPSAWVDTTYLRRPCAAYGVHDYVDYAPYSGCYDPLVYVGGRWPLAAAYTGACPPPYRTTYTRSACYSRPLYTRALVHSRSGYRIREYQRRAFRRSTCFAPERRVRVHRRAIAPCRSYRVAPFGSISRYRQHAGPHHAYPRLRYHARSPLLRIYRR